MRINTLLFSTTLALSFGLESFASAQTTNDGATSGRSATAKEADRDVRSVIVGGAAAGSMTPPGTSNQAAATARQGEDPNTENAGSRASRSLGVLVDEEQGALTISSIDVGSTAEHAGLRVGDRIVALNGRSVRSHQELVAEIQGSPFQSGLLIVIRDGLPQRVPLNWTSGSIRRATGNLGSNDETKFNGVGNGLRVGRVIDGSWMQTSGLVQNDRIISLNRTPVTARAQLIALLLDAAGSDGIPEMLVDRGGVPTTVQLHLPQGTLGPGSLSDVTYIVGTRGDIESAIGNIPRPSSGQSGTASGRGGATSVNGRSTAGSSTAGPIGSAATTRNGTARTASGVGSATTNLGNQAGSANQINGSVPGSTTGAAGSRFGSSTSFGGPNSSPGSAGANASGAGSASGGIGGTGGTGSASGVGSVSGGGTGGGSGAGAGT